MFFSSCIFSFSEQKQPFFSDDNRFAKECAQTYPPSLFYIIIVFRVSSKKLMFHVYVLFYFLMFNF
jgi:hypothetical protein